MASVVQDIGDSLGSTVADLQGDTKGAETTAKERAEKRKEDEKREEENRAVVHPGDYIVQIHVIEARDLHSRRGSNKVSPVAKVSVDVGLEQQKGHSKKYTDTAAPRFDRVFSFEFKNCLPSALETAVIKLAVYDAGAPLRDTIIGSYQFDLVSVYSRPNHEYHRQWLAISDNAKMKEYPGSQGYVLASVVVLGPGDKQVLHKGNEDDGASGVLMPPAISSQGRLLQCNVGLVQGLPKMDWLAVTKAPVDPFVKLDFCGQSMQTAHKNGRTVNFNKSLHIPVFEPNMSNNVKLSVYDWDQVGSNDRICTVNMSYHDIKNGISPRWFNLYGAPEGCQTSKVARAMNRGSADEPGSWWRGRILCGFDVEDHNKPLPDLVDCDELVQPTQDEYLIRCDLYIADSVPKIKKNKKKFHVEIRFGGAEPSTSNAIEPSKIRQIDWRKPMSEIRMRYPRDVTQVPKVFVYLCAGKFRFAYKSFDMQELMIKGWNSPPEWVNLQPDNCLNIIKNGFLAGKILMNLQGGRANRAPRSWAPVTRPLKNNLRIESQESAIGADQKAEAARRSTMTQPKVEEPPAVSTMGELTLSVIRATNLQNTDMFGKTDPFFTIQHMSNPPRETKVCKKTYAPVFSQEFSFPNVSATDTITMQLYDHDAMSRTSVGSPVTINLTEVITDAGVDVGRNFTHEFHKTLHGVKGNNKKKASTLYLAVTMQYYDVKVAESKAKAQATAELAAYERKQAAEAKKRSRGFLSPTVKAGAALGDIKYKDYELRVHLFQAKDLPAMDSNGLSDPYVTVQYGGRKMKFPAVKNSLNPNWMMSKSTAVKVIVTQNGDTGLAPSIEVAVYDADWAGASQLMGRLWIPISDALSMAPDLNNPTPFWFPLMDWKYEPMAKGSVLMSVQLLPNPPLRPRPALPDITPNYMDFNLSLTTLGLRNLQSAFGVHKTRCSFSMPGGQVFYTDPSRNPSKKNPNFLQTIIVPVKIPRPDSDFSAIMDLAVQDYLFGGISKRIIGSGIIQMGHFIEADPSNPRGYKIRGHDNLEQQEHSGPVTEFTTGVLAAISHEQRMKNYQELLDDMKQAKIAAEEQDKALKDVEAAIAQETKEAEEAAQTNREQKRQEARKEMEEKVKERDAQNAEKKGFAAKLQADIESQAKKNDEKQLMRTGMDSSSGDLEMDEIIDIQEEKEKQKDDSDSDEDEGKKEDDETVGLLSVFKAKDYDCVELYNKKPVPYAETTYPFLKGRAEIKSELEDYIHMAPFQEIELHYGSEEGQVKANKNSSSSIFSSKIHKAGKWKGVMQLKDPAEDKKSTETDPWLRELMTPADVYVRVYITQGFQFAALDRDNQSDPYLIVKCGNKKISTRKRYIKKTLNPDFYESFEFTTTLPGTSTLRIEAWDYDGIGDDFIGATDIDIENRYFTPNWRDIEMKPLETRTLWNPSSGAPQGSVQCWVEVLSAVDGARTALTDITPPPDKEFELRVIAWQVKDCPPYDSVTKMSDIFVKGNCDSTDKTLETDVHYRSKNGIGNFNWRMKWPVALPGKRWPRLKLSVWDKDLLAPDDSIGEVLLGLEDLCKRALFSKRRCYYTVGGERDFWLKDIKMPVATKESKKGLPKLKVRIELLPKAMSEEKNNGQGRSEPNMQPFLPPPEGRISLSLNPIKMCYEILGDDWMKTALKGFCVGLLVTAICYMIPFLISNGLAAATN